MEHPDYIPSGATFMLDLCAMLTSYMTIVPLWGFGMIYHPR